MNSARAVFYGFILCGGLGHMALADTAASPEPLAPNAPEEATPFTLTTTAFLNEGVLPVLYTCDGKNISPEFNWTNPPKGTKAFAMVALDPKAPTGTWYHWVVYNISNNTTEIPEGMHPPLKGAVIAKNSWGNTKYEGPCPPKGTVHTYQFTVYALSKPVHNVDSGPTLLKAMKGSILGTQVQTTVYSRWNG